MRLIMLALVALLATPVNAQPQPAPDFALKTLTGVNLRLSEHRGQVVVLAFWTSWCRECRELLQILQRLHGEIPASDMLIMAVSADSNDKRAASASAGVARSYPILLDVKQDVAKAYRIDTIPSVLIVDRDGMIAQTFTGSVVVSTDLAAAVKALVER